MVTNITKKEDYMSKGDKTGPAGMGPMTGRGTGYCSGYLNPGFMNNYCEHMRRVPKC